MHFFSMESRGMVTGRSEQDKHWFMSCVQHAREVSFHTSALPWYITCWDCVKTLWDPVPLNPTFLTDTLGTGCVEQLPAWARVRRTPKRTVSVRLDTPASHCGPPDMSWAQAVSWEASHGTHTHTAALWQRLLWCSPPPGPCHQDSWAGIFRELSWEELPPHRCSCKHNTWCPLGASGLRHTAELLRYKQTDKLKCH